MSDITGTLTVKFDAVQVSEKFKKRELVLTIGDQYPQTVLFQLTQDKCVLLDNYKEGDDIKVYYNLRGRRYEKDNKVSYFNSIEIWKIERVGATTETTVSEAQATPSGQEDSLPF